MPETLNCVAYRNGVWQDIPLDDISEQLELPDSFVWVELSRPDHAILRRLEGELGLHELAVEDALSAHQRPKLEEYQGSLFLALRTARWWQKRVHFGEVHAFCGPQFLVVIRHDSGPGFGRVLDRLRASKHPPHNGFALYALFDHVVDEFKPIFLALEDSHVNLEGDLLSEAFAGASLGRLYELKRELLRLHDAIQPVGDIVQDLIRLHPDLTGKTLRAYYRDVHDHAVRPTRDIDRLREMLSDAMQLTLAAASLKQNESVQKLAGWGAILAIPTLVFSLYGMNFSYMPELEWPWGYPVALMATGLACFGLYRHLRRCDWI